MVFRCFVPVSVCVCLCLNVGVMCAFPYPPKRCGCMCVEKMLFSVYYYFSFRWQNPIKTIYFHSSVPEKRPERNFRLLEVFKRDLKQLKLLPPTESNKKEITGEFPRTSQCGRTWSKGRKKNRTWILTLALTLRFFSSESIQMK